MLLFQAVSLEDAAYHVAEACEHALFGLRSLLLPHVQADLDARYQENQDFCSRLGGVPMLRNLKLILFQSGAASEERSVLDTRI